MKLSAKYAGLLLASTALVLAAQPAAAQQPATQENGRVLTGLEEIVITARKREESLQTVPVAVSAISRQQLERYDITNLEKIASMTPQFNVGRASNGSGAQLTLRGIGSSSTSIGIEQSVAVIVDGVYYGQGRVINEGFFDMERAEILKGPQALFFGKNATAGVISLTTANPTDEIEVMARVGYEIEAEDLIGEAVGSGPLSDTLGIRLALRGSKMWGGYYKNRGGPVTYTTQDLVSGDITNHLMPASASEQPGTEEILGRVTLRWEPSERLDATLKASFDRNNNNNSSWNYVNYRSRTGSSTLNPVHPAVRDFVVFQNNIAPEIAAELPFARDGELYNRYRSYSVTGTVNYNLDNINFTSVTNFQTNKNQWLCACDFQSSDFGTWATEDSKWDAFSTEFRALTDYDGPVNLMLGIYYQKTKREFDQWVMFAGVENSDAPAGERYTAMSKNSETDGETISGFGQVIWDILPEVELAGGLRYTHETKDSYFVHPYVHPALVGAIQPNNRLAADQTFNDWSPEATITWTPTEQLTLYGGYKTAYKSGGFSNSAIFGGATVLEDFTFEPEKAKGFEVGLKTQLLDNRLRFDVTAYTYKYTNLQVDFFNSPTFAYITTNAGSAKAEGIEAQFEWAPPVAGLQLRGSVNYNKARYGSFIAPCYTGQTPAAGCDIVGPAPGFTPFQDLSGVETAVAPRWTASLGGSYETPITDGLILGLSADARYSDSYLASGFGNPLSRQDEFVIVDASVRLRTADDQWELAFIGRNLTDQFYVSSVVDGPSTGGGTGTPGGMLADQLGHGGLPRTMQVQLTWRY